MIYLVKQANMSLRPDNLGLANMGAGPSMSFAIQSLWLNYGQGCCSIQWPVQCPFDTCC